MRSVDGVRYNALNWPLQDALNIINSFFSWPVCEAIIWFPINWFNWNRKCPSILPHRIRKCIFVYSVHFTWLKVKIYAPARMSHKISVRESRMFSMYSWNRLESCTLQLFDSVTHYWIVFSLNETTSFTQVRISQCFYLATCLYLILTAISAKMIQTRQNWLHKELAGFACVFAIVYIRAQTNRRQKKLAEMVTHCNNGFQRRLSAK